MTEQTTRDPQSPLARALARLAADPEGVEREVLEAQEAALAEARARPRRARWGRFVETRPDDYADSSFARLLPQQRCQGLVEGWWDSGVRQLMLAGVPGHGKTDAAWAILNFVAALDRDGRADTPRTVRGWSWPELRATYLPPTADQARDEVAAAARARIHREVLDCDLLLLDDVTAAADKEAARDVLYRILDPRVNDASKRTIVTLNAESRDDLGGVLAAHLGGPIVSRLRKGSVVGWVQGESLRRFAPWNPFEAA